MALSILFCPRSQYDAKNASLLLKFAVNHITRSHRMFPFSDVAHGHVISTRAFDQFEHMIHHCAQNGYYSPSDGADEDTGMSEADMSYFYLLARSLDLILTYDEKSFRNCIFYDCSGSGGRMTLGAALLEHWAKVESVEGTESGRVQAEHLMKVTTTRPRRDGNILKMLAHDLWDFL